MSSNSRGQRPKNRKGIDEIQDYVIIDNKITDVELIKRFTGNKIFLHWALLFEVPNENADCYIYFEFLNSGVDFEICESRFDAYETFIGGKYKKTTSVYYRKMRNFKRVTLRKIIDRVRELKQFHFHDSSYHAVHNNCQDFVFQLAQPFDHSAILINGTPISNIIASDFAAYAKDVESLKLNALIGMEKYDVCEQKPKEKALIAADELDVAKAAGYVTREDRHLKTGFGLSAISDKTSTKNIVKLEGNVQLGKNGIGLDIQPKLAHFQLHDNEDIRVNVGIQADTGLKFAKDGAKVEVLGFGLSVDNEGIGIKLPLIDFKFKC